MYFVAKEKSIKFSINIYDKISLLTEKQTPISVIL